MQRLRPDTSSGISPQPTLAIASSESGWVQVLALTASSCTAYESPLCNTINLCVIVFQNRNAYVS